MQTLSVWKGLKFVVWERVILPEDTLVKKPRGSSEAQVLDLQVTSHTFYHRATQDPLPNDKILD